MLWQKKKLMQERKLKMKRVIAFRGREETGRDSLGQKLDLLYKFDLDHVNILHNPKIFSLKNT